MRSLLSYRFFILLILVVGLTLGGLSLVLADHRARKVVEVKNHVVKITLNDYYIEPQNITVRGNYVKIIVTNNGKQTHDFRLNAFIGTNPLLPGQKAEFTTFLTKRSYQFFSSQHNDQILGMYGNLMVRP